MSTLIRPISPRRVGGILEICNVFPPTLRQEMGLIKVVIGLVIPDKYEGYKDLKLKTGKNQDSPETLVSEIPKPVRL